MEAKRISLSRICYDKYTKNSYYLQVCRPLFGEYFKHSLCKIALIYSSLQNCIQHTQNGLCRTCDYDFVLNTLKCTVFLY